MNEKKEKFKCLRYLLWIVVTGFLTVVICQIMNGGNLISLGYIKLILGALVVVILMFLAELITLCPRISIAFGLIATGLISTSNYFVYRFRGIEFVPTDMLTIVTAANVAGHYTFSVTIPFIICWVVLLGIVILSFVFLPKIKRKHKAVRRLADLVLIVVIAVGIFVVAGKNDILVQHFADHGTNENGYILNFYLALKDVFPSKPEGYSYKNVDEVAEKISDSKDMGKRPTVIAILDESFSDFSIILFQKTLSRAMPFPPSMAVIRPTRNMKS